MIKQNSFSNTWIHLISALYFYFLAPIIYNNTMIVLQGKKEIPWVGFLILVLILAETYAYFKKMKFVNYFYHKMNKSIGVGGFVLWLMHFVVIFFFLYVALAAFGYKQILDDGDQIPSWISLLFFVTALKEIIFIMPIVDMSIMDKQNVKPQKKWYVDVILLLNTWLIYTILWMTLASSGQVSLQVENIGMYILNIILASVVFLFFYLPLRIPYILQDILKIKTTTDFIKFSFPIVLVLYSAISKL
jgi:hypothetical protein